MARPPRARRRRVPRARQHRDHERALEPTLTAELIRSALESAPDAMLIVAPEGAILFANRQVNALFGYSGAEAEGLTVEDLMPQSYGARHRERRGQFLSEHRVRPMGTGLELLARRKDGTEFPVEISLSPIQDGERQLVAAAIRDITEHKRIQCELLAARQAAERANQTKSRFLATASHDLRQPLQSLALLNGALRRMVGETHAQEALHYQEMAIGAMSRLLNALLDVSKLESGAVQPQPSDMDIGPLFAELEQEFAGVAATKRLTLEVIHGGECVHCDPALLGQIVRNLLSNALKYTHTGGVRLTSARGAQEVLIEVSDTGIGIEAAQLPRIYDEFYQIEPVGTVRREGYGLGLSIVRRLVELLGLRLEARSEPGKGSVFTLRLPPGARCAELPEEASAEAAPARPRESPCVLLVEDDAAVRDATGLLLRLEGYEVRPAGSLAEALECIGGGARIDLIITDYHLGGAQTGTDVIARARARLGEGLPAVLITGDTSSAIRRLESSRLRLASKPIRADELLRLLKALLASASQESAGPAQGSG
jgi:PAS domain S-box-containing protein